MSKIQKSILFILIYLTIPPVFAQYTRVPMFLGSHRHQTSLFQATFDSGMQKYDVIFQCLNFRVDPSVYYIEGEVSINYKAIVNLDTLVLNLSDSLTIDSIKQRSNILNFSHSGGLIKIDIDDISVASLDSLTIYYQGAPSRANNAFFISVQDSVNNIPVLATLSEPYGASDWWPCKNNLTDKIDSIDIEITCPNGNIAVSLGLLTDSVVHGTETSYVWKHRFPVAPYLVSVAVSNYYEYHSYIKTSVADSILFLNYLYQNNLSQKELNIDKTELFVNIYDSLFINYPFKSEKYGHVEFPVLGGMEHQTISSMGRFDFEIISHELAHQWFGDYLTCGSWADIWLNEGFATYCTGLCYENYQNAYWWPIWKQVSVSSITTDSTGTVSPIDTLDQSVLFSSRLTYRKASYLLHMIRWTIGDEDFFQGIRNYLNDENLSFSFAKTPNLIAHFEQEADTSLTEFMDDWFYGEGYPVYDVEWSQVENHQMLIELNQNSAIGDEHFFKLYVPIQLIGEGDTLNLRLDNQYNQQQFSIDVPFMVDTVLFDPDLWLISKNSSVSLSIHEILNKNLTIFPNPTSQFVNIVSENKIENVQIFDLEGRLIIDTSKLKINMSNYANGVYFMRIKTKQHLLTKRIVKM